MEGHQPATEEPLRPMVLTFHTPKIQKIKGDRSYQRRVVPTQNHWAAVLSPGQQQRLLKQTHVYVRAFCTALCGFTLVLLLCLSPLPWVQFLLAEKGIELHAGLWTVCEHELCWSHIPMQPYYLQISRILFLLSAFTAFIILAWVISSCRYPKEPSSHLDQGVAILALSSGASLFFCLVFFLMQVKKYTSYSMGSSYLWIFHFNWWGSFFYIVAALVSIFNYKTFGVLPSDQAVPEIFLARRRLGINPKMWSTPAIEEEEMAADPVVEIESIVTSLERKDDHKVNSNK